MSAGSEAEAHSDPGSITEGLLILKKVLNPSEPQVPHQKMWILMMVTQGNCDVQVCKKSFYGP